MRFFASRPGEPLPPVPCRNCARSPALAGYRKLVDEPLPWIERRLVREARADGVTWTVVGRQLGRSRQAPQQRHDRLADMSEALPPSVGRTWVELFDDERRGIGDDVQRTREIDAAGDEGSLVPW